MGVIDRIFAQARATPDKTAMVHDGQALSYAAFVACIVAVRRYAHAAGVARDRVAVLCIRDLAQAWIVGLALRSLGVTTLSVRTAGDLAALALPSPMVVGVTAEPWPDLDAAAAAIRAPLMMVPAGPAGVDEAVETPDGARGGHILLTSGTTGAHKKVLYAEASEADAAASRAILYGFDSDTVINVFGFGGWTAVGYLYPVSVWWQGGTVVVDQRADLYCSLNAPGLTHILTTPALLAELLRAPLEVSLRQPGAMLTCTGGPLPPALWRAARERVTSDVRTGIGSTEVGATALTPISAEDDLPWHRIDPAHELQVVGEDGQPVPTGEMGIVRIRQMLIHGYLGDPEASAAFFRDGYFYPGDLAVAREDGRIALRGRVTDVINVMGEKVGVLPLESALQDRLDAAAVCILSIPGPDGEAVHVAIQPERVIGMAELRDALSAVLPRVAEVQAHKVEAMPRNHMGKIDRTALRVLLFPPGDGA
jgi:acyl-coenzyme A synthetase/AMP-(fatty) acid ligase